ncbi:MAG: tagaturonate reductase, partial [Clostridia bacterium]|nr:tagaturonate reductase [Clostridia bacterium]
MIMKERFIQFGEGGFLRGFVDWMIKKMNDTADFGAKVVVVQPIDKGMCDLLSAQNNVYHHLIRGVEGVETTEIDVISRCIKPYEDFNSFLDLAKNPDFRFVVSNTTESGIVFDQNDKEGTAECSFPA